MGKWGIRKFVTRIVMPQVSTTLLVLLFLLTNINTSFGQYNAKRDAIKVGYAQAKINSKSVFVPSVYLEYTRVFVQPFTIGVSGHYAKASGIVTDTEDQTLNTYAVDFNGYYSIVNNDYSNFQLGVGFSARVFKTDWIVRATDTEEAFGGQDNHVRPGFSAIVNYDYTFDPLFIGLRGSFHSYSIEGSVLLIGAHLGLRF